jgi:hypothetical protein
MIFRCELCEELHTNFNFIYTGSEDICILEVFVGNRLVAVVSHTSPQMLKVYNYKRGPEVCHSYSSTILAVKINRAVSK